MNTLTTVDQNSAAVKNYFRTGDVAPLSLDEKDWVLAKLCERYDLDPVLRPFDLISFKGVQKFYMTASATNQLADKKKLSRKVMSIDIDWDKMIARCNVQVSDPSGRCEDSNAFISISRFVAPTKENPKMTRVLLEGDDLANTLSKLETKAKRRATLSFFGILDSNADEEATTAKPAEAFLEITATEEKEPEPEAKKRGRKPAAEKETKEPVKETSEEPLAKTKAKEAEIEASFEDTPFAPPTKKEEKKEGKKILYSRMEHAEYFVRTIAKILNNPMWTKDVAMKEKAKNIIPELDGKVYCIYEDNNEVCPEFERAIREKIC